MTKIYACFIQPVEKKLFDALLFYVDEQVKVRIKRYKKREDQVRTLLAHTLSKMVLAQELSLTPQHLSYKVTKYGKYELANHEMFFNLSHSNEYVVCAVSHKRVGIDIEKKQQRNFQLFTNVWSDREKKHYNIYDRTTFYQLWTAKESYVKYLGIGLSTSLPDISVYKDGSIGEHQQRSEAQIEYVNVDKEYVCAVCSEEQIDSIEIISIKQLAYFYQRLCFKK